MVRKQGELQVDAPAVEVEIQVGDEPIQRHAFKGQTRRFDVHAPLRKMEQAVDGKIALERLEELGDLFPDVPLRVENTGTAADGTILPDQAEFTALCLERGFDVQIDIGHANANGWDIPRLLHDLKDRIRGYHLHNNDGIHDQHRRLGDGTVDYDRLLPLIRRETPGAELVIEYTRPDLHGEPLCEDIAMVLRFLQTEAKERKEPC